MILGDFLKAVGQLGDARFQKVLWLGIALALGLLALVTWGFVAVVGWFVPDSMTIPWIGTIGWPEAAASWAMLGVMLVASVFLMVPVASAMTGLMLDEVAAAVEARHYPHLPPAPPTPWRDVIADSAAFMGVLLVANIVMLFIYGFAGLLAPVLFWAVNGFLLGREYFQMAAMRRHGRAGATALRKRYTGRVWLAGVLMAVPLSIPLVNLLVPILGAATFTHQMHRLTKAAPSG